MKKRVVFLMCVLIVGIFSVNVCGAEDTLMNKTRVYESDLFNDLSEQDWFYQNVVNAYEYGVMSGTGANTFEPDGNITICQAITIASRINNILYKGNRQIPTDNEIWYMPYIQYAENSGIISKGKFLGRYEQDITRAEFVYVICNSMESGELTNENPFIKSIPDMLKTDNYYTSILTAVKSGIITGKDNEGNFFPNDKITRAEASAILNRIIDRDTRKSTVREIYINKLSDKTELYEENELVRNYGEFNKIYSIFRGYYSGSKETVVIYTYRERQLKEYLDMMEDNNFIVHKSVQGVKYSEYLCSKEGITITIGIFHDYQQVWIVFPMNSDYYDGKFKPNINTDNNEEIEEIKQEKPEWDTSHTFLENDKVKNYGYQNKISCLSREVFYDSNEVRVRYKYDFYPDHFIRYCETLDNSGYKLDTLSVDSNALFLDSSYRMNNSYVRIYVNLIEKTIDIEFDKTKASDL